MASFLKRSGLGFVLLPHARKLEQRIEDAMQREGSAPPAANDDDQPDEEASTKAAKATRQSHLAALVAMSDEMSAISAISEMDPDARSRFLEQMLEIGASRVGQVAGGAPRRDEAESGLELPPFREPSVLPPIFRGEPPADSERTHPGRLARTEGSTDALPWRPRVDRFAHLRHSERNSELFGLDLGPGLSDDHDKDLPERPDRRNKSQSEADKARSKTTD